MRGPYPRTGSEGFYPGTGGVNSEAAAPSPFISFPSGPDRAWLGLCLQKLLVREGQAEAQDKAAGAWPLQWPQWTLQAPAGPTPSCLCSSKAMCPLRASVSFSEQQDESNHPGLLPRVGGMNPTLRWAFLGQPWCLCSKLRVRHRQGPLRIPRLPLFSRAWLTPTAPDVLQCLGLSFPPRPSPRAAPAPPITVLKAHALPGGAVAGICLTPGRGEARGPHAATQQTWCGIQCVWGTASSGLPVARLADRRAAAPAGAGEGLGHQGAI